MKQPINLLLYTASLGMLGAAGHQFYYAVPDLGAETSPSEAHKQGSERASKRLEIGRGQDAQAAAWDYTTPRESFWSQFVDVNFTGKLPPEPVTEVVEVPDVVPVAQRERPISEILTLLGAMRDSSRPVAAVPTGDEGSEGEVGTAGDGTAGNGGAGASGVMGNSTNVTLHYKPGSGVEIPESKLRQATAGGAPSMAGIATRSSGPRTGALARGLGADATPPSGGARTAPPTSGAVETVTDIVFVGESLWPPFEHITLSRVAEDGRSAFFVRQSEGAEPVEEEVFLTQFGIDNDILAQLAEDIRARAGRAAGDTPKPSTVPDTTSVWREQQYTGPLPGSPNDIIVGVEDSATFSNSPDELFKKVNLTAYRMRNGTAGLKVANVDSQLAQRYNIQRGDVILSVNGQPVTSQAKAISQGRKLYDRGVRTFRVEVLTMGRTQTRIYHADPSQ